MWASQAKRIRKRSRRRVAGLSAALTSATSTRSGSKSRKLMTGTPRKKGHPTSEVLAPAEVESEVVVKVGRAGGMV